MIFRNFFNPIAFFSSYMLYWHICNFFIKAIFVQSVGSLKLQPSAFRWNSTETTGLTFLWFSIFMKSISWSLIKFCSSKRLLGWSGRISSYTMKKYQILHLLSEVSNSFEHTNKLHILKSLTYLTFSWFNDFFQKLLH